MTKYRKIIKVEVPFTHLSPGKNYKLVTYIEGLKKELEDIKSGMASAGTVVYFKNDHNVKNVYFCASNRVVKDEAINKEELIKSSGNKIKLSKKTALIKLDQVLFAE